MRKKKLKKYDDTYSEYPKKKKPQYTYSHRSIYTYTHIHLYWKKISRHTTISVTVLKP